MSSVRGKTGAKRRTRLPPKREMQESEARKRETERKKRNARNLKITTKIDDRTPRKREMRGI
jgi:hypothetical protein